MVAIVVRQRAGTKFRVVSTANGCVDVPCRLLLTACGDDEMGISSFLKEKCYHKDFQGGSDEPGKEDGVKKIACLE